MVKIIHWLLGFCAATCMSLFLPFYSATYGHWFHWEKKRNRCPWRIRSITFLSLFLSCIRAGNRGSPLSSAARDSRNLARNRSVRRCNAHRARTFYPLPPECVMESRRYIGENCWGGRHHCCDLWLSILCDKISHRVGFEKCFLRDSPSLPWLQGIRQQGRYISGSLRKQFTKPTLQGILSVSTCGK